MFLGKKIRNNILENYHSKESFYIIKILFFIVYTIVLFFVIKFIEKPEVKLLLLVLFIPSLFVLNWYIEILFLPSLRIEINMPELPEKIGKEKTIVQYSLPKGVTPSEVGIMMSGKAEITNLICIVYRWVNDWLVKIVDENGVKYIEVIDDLWKRVSEYDGSVRLNGGVIKIGRDNGVRYVKAMDDSLWKKLPEYEYYLFYKLFAGVWYRVKFNRLKKFKLKVNDMIIKSCAEKWYLEVTTGELPNSEGMTYINNSSIWCAVLICFFSCLIFAILNLWLWSIISSFLMIWILLLSRGSALYFVRPTNKWKKLLSEIVWYKYYLEHCEEEQINSDLEEGEIYSRHLPYAIALKLNWKMIDKLS